MASGSDFSGEERFMDQFMSDDQSMSDVSFDSSDESWDPFGIRDSDSDYNEISDIEDLEYASDD